MHKRLLKVIILGNTCKFYFNFILTYAFALAIGKSCVLTRLTKDQFDTEHTPTVGVDFGSCLIKVEDTILKL